MTKKEAIERIKKQRDWALEVDRLLDVEAFNIAIKTLDDFDTLNVINSDLASENENLKEKIEKLIGYINYQSQRKGKKMAQLEQFISNEWKVKECIDIEEILDILEKFTGRKTNNEKNN